MEQPKQDRSSKAGSNQELCVLPERGPSPSERHGKGLFVAVEGVDKRRVSKLLLQPTSDRRVQGYGLGVVATPEVARLAPGRHAVRVHAALKSVKKDNSGHLAPTF